MVPSLSVTSNQVNKPPSCRVTTMEKSGVSTWIPLTFIPLVMTIKSKNGAPTRENALVQLWLTKSGEKPRETERVLLAHTQTVKVQELLQLTTTTGILLFAPMMAQSQLELSKDSRIHLCMSCRTHSNGSRQLSIVQMAIGSLQDPMTPTFTSTMSITDTLLQALAKNIMQH